MSQRISQVERLSILPPLELIRDYVNLEVDHRKSVVNINCFFFSQSLIEAMHLCITDACSFVSQKT